MRREAKPRTLREAIRYLSDPDRCLDFALSLRWPRGVECPECGSRAVSFLATRQVWKCRNNHPRRQFSVKSGTMFEDSAIGMDKWFAAIWMVANGPEDLSSYTVARELGVTQKTAWFMLRRIRLAMRSGSFEKALLAGASLSVAPRRHAEEESERR